jgi:hypothetical protein
MKQPMDYLMRLAKDVGISFLWVLAGTLAIAATVLGAWAIYHAGYALAHLFGMDPVTCEGYGIIALIIAACTGVLTHMRRNIW